MKTKINFNLRKQIEAKLAEGKSILEISKELDIWESTVRREKKKCEGVYNAEEAEKNTCKGYHPIDMEIIGKKYGLLTIIEYTNNIINHRTYWKALCDCGNITYISRKKLGDYCSPDRPFSCGCIAKEHCGRNLCVPIEEAALRKYQDLLSFREMDGKCWTWTGYARRGRLPMTSWKNKVMTVRKCMYLIMAGITYEPEYTHAGCRNLLCFNPEHVKLGKPPKGWYE